MLLEMAVNVSGWDPVGNATGLVLQEEGTKRVGYFIANEEFPSVL